MGNKTLITVTLIILAIASFIFGWNIKPNIKCNEVIKTDTVIKYITKVDSFISKPTNKVIHITDTFKSSPTVVIKNDSVYIYDTIKRQQYFTGIDTLRNNNDWVVVLDTGNCDGVFKRKNIWNKVDKTETITNTLIEKNKPFIFFIGVGVPINKSLTIQDVVPKATLIINKKYLTSYGYGVMKNQHYVELGINPW